MEETESDLISDYFLHPDNNFIIINNDNEKYRKVFNQLIGKSSYNFYKKQDSSVSKLRNLTKDLAESNSNSVETSSLSSNTSSSIIECNKQLIILTNNQIKDLSLWYSSSYKLQFPYLLQLNLSFNNIKEISQNFFSSMKLLQSLDLSHNKLINLDFLSLFSIENPELKVLKLHSNQIESLYYLNSIKKESIQELWLNSNKIAEWAEFQYLTNYTELKILNKNQNLTDNKSNLNDYILYLCPNIKYLDMNEINSTLSNSISKDLSVDIKVMITQANVYRKNLGNRLKSASADNLENVPLSNNLGEGVGGELRSSSSSATSRLTNIKTNDLGYASSPSTPKYNVTNKRPKAGLLNQENKIARKSHILVPSKVEN